MKKKIKAIALAAVMSLGMTCGMTGCGDDDDKGGGGGSLSTVGESTYILISNADRVFTSSERIEKGQGIKKALEKCGEAEAKDKPYIVGSMVYLNDGKFKLFDGTQMGTHRVVSGNYSIGGDEVKFENNRVDVESLKNGKKSYYDMTTDTAENLKGVALQGLQEELKTMNDGSCLYKCPNPPSFYDVQNVTGITLPKGLYTGKGEFSEYYTPTQNNPDGYKLYSKGDYLVCRQNGYTFENKPGDDNFVIKCESTIYSYTNYMHPDGTWDGELEDYDEKITGGTWEKRGDNLIVVTNPNSSTGVDAYLYLDYSANEIYLPVYMKCNDFLDIAKNAE